MNASHFEVKGSNFKVMVGIKYAGNDYFRAEE